MKRFIILLLPYTQTHLDSIVNPAEQWKVDQFVRRYRRATVNSLLEYLILLNLEKVPLCGYDIMVLIYDRFHVMLSPGQVYPVIDSLAKNGIIQKQQDGRRVLLRLTSLGQSLLKTWKYEYSSLQLQIGNLLAIGETSA